MRKCVLLGALVVPPPLVVVLVQAVTVVPRKLTLDTSNSTPRYAPVEALLLNPRHQVDTRQGAIRRPEHLATALQRRGKRLLAPAGTEPRWPGGAPLVAARLMVAAVLPPGPEATLALPQHLQVGPMALGPVVVDTIKCKRQSRSHDTILLRTQWNSRK